jgi:hypothetical protein
MRHSCEATIKWSQFNKAIYFDATLMNFSERGVYFETAHELRPGTAIFLDMKTVPSDKIIFKDHKRPRLVSLGEVKWCVNLSEDIQSKFGVGVGYPFLY